jgi:iron complex outermembrane receptor protein
MNRNQLALAVTAALGAAGVAYAADDQPSAESADQLAEITVTATRQATTIQTTPISITAFTADQISSRGIVDVDSLVSSVPAIAARNNGGPGEVEFEIRGLNSQGGNSSMVGMYLGEIPLSTAMGSQLGKNSMNPGLYDLQRVEVLSGPQGTLYGSSSMGGTIRLIPAPAQLNTYAASTQETVSGTASGGSINHQENGMINLPLGDTAAVRVVGSFTNNSGWVKRLVIDDGAVPVDTGAFPAVSRPSNFYTAPLQEVLNGVNTSEIDSIRAQILWKPTDNLTIEPMAMYQLIQQDGPPAVDVNGNPTHPQVPAVWGHYEVYDAPEPQTDSLSFGSLNVVYQLPYFSLTSATGFWHRDFIDNNDDTEQVASAVGIPVYDAAAGGIGPDYSIRGPGNSELDYTRQISEEFRITSTAPGPLQWVAGYFYQDLYSLDAVSALAPQATPIFGGTNLSVNTIPEVLIQNAVYGNLSWRFSSHFELAAGFRHYHYNLHETSSQYGAFTVSGAEGNDIPYNASAAIAASGTVPSASLTYNIDADHMVYFRAGKGFRLGGASGDVGPVAVAPAGNTNPLFAAEVANECGLQAKVLLAAACNPNIFLQVPATYGSDSLWSYELGEKSSFFGHRLIANLDAYLEDWYNPQFATNLAGYGLTVNGGDARIKGVEVQLQGLLPAGFALSVNASYTDAKFVESNALTGFPAGAQIPDTPQVAGSLVLDWKHALSNGLALFGSLEDDYTATRTSLPFGVAATLLNVNQVLVHMPAYSIANFRIGLKGERDNGQHWSAAFFVNNLANKQVLLDPQPQIALQTQAFERYVISQPLTAGIDVSYAF